MENPFITIVPKVYVDAVLELHKIFQGKNIRWALSGDLGEAFRTVKVEPDCIEILTSKEDAQRIHDLIKEQCSEQLVLRTQKLPRDAMIENKTYPVYVRSYYFEFKVESVPVKVHGDLQFKVNSWEWGDKLEFTPENVYVVNKKTPVVPLSVKLELYRNLGWADRAEKIQATLRNRQLRLPRRFR